MLTRNPKLTRRSRERSSAGEKLGHGRFNQQEEASIAASRRGKVPRPFIPEATEQLQDAITRESIRGWLSAGLIWVEPKKGNSRGRFRIRRLKRKKRGLGQGGKKGAQGARVGKKSIWVARVRMLRRILKMRRDRWRDYESGFQEAVLAGKGSSRLGQGRGWTRRNSQGATEIDVRMPKSHYVHIFRRRREGKTDYRKRKGIIVGKSPFVSIRISGKYIYSQIMKPTATGDLTLCAASWRDIVKKFGWKGSTKSLRGRTLLVSIWAPRWKGKCQTGHSVFRRG